MKNPSTSILIRADGSHAIGLGHIFRMRTLAIALTQSGYRVSFLSLADQIATETLGVAGLTIYPFTSDSYGQELTKVLAERSPDLILQDVLDTTERGVEGLRKHSSAKLIHFDDTRAGLDYADAVINSMVFHWNRYESSHVRAKLYEGPQYAILPPEIAAHRQARKLMPDFARRILVAIGGTDTHFVTERVMQALNAIQIPLSITINLGPGAKQRHALNMAVAESKHKVNLLQSTPNLVLEYLKHDLVICGGGTMLYELAALGIPSMCIATEPHEILNMEYWASQGTSMAAGCEKHLCTESMAGNLSTVLEDRKLRIRMSAKGQKVMDHNGVQRVLTIIAEVLK
jgi:spore coat polysaccharide biosynthesis predicted glycosyltransferase SpsG